MTRRGLGRGLDALLPTHEAPAATDGSFRDVPIEAIVPNPRQPRATFDEDALEDLASSIATLGLLQPVLVRDLGARFELIAGERRWRAAQAAGLREVPAIVVETDERGSLERALVENIHREDLNPLEEAAAYRQLLEEGGMTQEQLGSRLGRSRVAIANTLRLLELPVEVQRLLRDGRLTAGHGKALLGLHGNPFLERIAQRAAAEGLTVRETEDLVRRYQAMTGASPARSHGTIEISSAAREIQQRLADHLQTRVRIEMGKRKGKLVVDFVSLDELERLYGVIAGEARGATVRTVAP